MSTPAPDLPHRPFDRYKAVMTALLVVLVLWSALELDAKWSRLVDLPQDLWTLGRLMFTRMEAGKIDDLVGAMWESISIAWMGTLIAALFAIPMSFFAAENLTGRWGCQVMRQIFNLLRAVPEIILALIFIPVFGLTPMAGVLAIGIGSIGTLGKLFYEIIEGIQRGPIEAVDAVGSTRIQRLRWGVLPQVSPELASLVMYRFEVNIRASAVLGVVGAGGIGGDLQQALLFKDFGTAGLGLIIIVIGTITVDTISGAIRRRIVRGRPSALEHDSDDEELALAVS